MAYETYQPLFHEIFTQVNNAKDKPKKIAVLRKYEAEGLKNFLMCAFNPDIEWILPEGDVPYMPNDAPEGTEHTMLHQEAQNFFYYVKKLIPGTTDQYVFGSTDINDARREMMFIQMLEGLSAAEAELVLQAKNRTLNKKYKGLNANTVREAFGWDENFIDQNLVAQRQSQPRDLGRMPQDIADSQRR
jgi:hypothetical protein|tara:strand:- start:577 stop:1140 length:564 start_codon:yes stop_codon:yes gene_type:complete